ncbi:Ca2+-binding protein, EF-hand superfamily [Azospirillum oryzae]|uniref:Ca2+-binding protein, EF-hand superfamily n=1 Tax=Azospirillum oryzae TaxID=286727 RepID=A0A1X7HEK6_9PROT|nr:EF-hand domain-containing protein [Azospirillum oryzae]SMF84159.1 Ca2+-binding protein, EF-hand superfamily [Azospirillum oryzae]
MISSLGSSSSAATLQKFFSKADANSDSSLSKDELLGALGGTSAASDSDTLSSAVDGLIGSLDSDKSGSLSATEFSSFSSRFDHGSGSALLAAQEQASAMQQQFAQNLYSSLDSDSSGGISTDELTSALTSAGQSSTDASSLFGSLDSDEDGSISEDELSSALKEADANRPPPPPPPPANDSDTASASDSTSDSGTASAGGTTSYDPLDTNKDGYVSEQERMAAYGGGTQQQAGGVTSNRLSGDMLRTLMQGINEVAA